MKGLTLIMVKEQIKNTLYAMFDDECLWNEQSIIDDFIEILIKLSISNEKYKKAFKETIFPILAPYFMGCASSELFEKKPWIEEIGIEIIKKTLIFYGLDYIPDDSLEKEMLNTLISRISSIVSKIPVDNDSVNSVIQYCWCLKDCSDFSELNRRSKLLYELLDKIIIRKGIIFSFENREEYYLLAKFGEVILYNIIDYFIMYDEIYLKCADDNGVKYKKYDLLGQELLISKKCEYIEASNTREKKDNWKHLIDLLMVTDSLQLVENLHSDRIMEYYYHKGINSLIDIIELKTILQPSISIKLFRKKFSKFLNYSEKDKVKLLNLKRIKLIEKYLLTFMVLDIVNEESDMKKEIDFLIDLFTKMELFELEDSLEIAIALVVGRLNEKNYNDVMNLEEYEEVFSVFADIKEGLIEMDLLE